MFCSSTTTTTTPPEANAHGLPADDARLRSNWPVELNLISTASCFVPSDQAREEGGMPSDLSAKERMTD